MARITFTTMYDTTMRYLQRNAGKLNKLEEQIASESKINRPSDNPVGFTNAMKYRNILNSLAQQRDNMNDGDVYMTILETSHQSMNELFGRCRELAVQGANDPLDHQARLFINMEVRQELEQLVSIAQTQHKDGYIFSGKWTDQPPYEIKKGEANFLPQPTYPTIAKANPNHNSNTTLPVINTSYDPTDPTATMFETGSITLTLFDNNFYDNNLSATESPNFGYPNAQRIIPGSIEGLNGLAEKPNKNTDLDPTHPDYDKPDYEIDYVNGTITLLSDKAKAAFYEENPSSPGNSRLRVPEDQIPNITFDYIYRNSIDMSGEIYRELDTDITMKVNSNPDNLFGKGGLGQTDSFKEIIALMQGLWYNDQPQINKGIDHIDAARERNLSEQAVTASRLNRVEMTRSRNEETTINDTKAQSMIEDVDLAEAYTQLSMSLAIYEASLQAAARIMQKSLMDYV